MLGCYKRKSITILKKTLRRCFNYWRCAHTDLLIQGGEQSEFTPQYVWQNPSRSIEQLLGFRFSQSVIGNTLLTLAGLALTLLFKNHSTLPHCGVDGNDTQLFRNHYRNLRDPRLSISSCGRTHRRVYIRLCIVGNTFKRELTVSLADE